MIFLAGALIGGVVVFLGGTLSSRRRVGLARPASGFAVRGSTTAIAVLALLVAVLALVRSDRRDHSPAAPTSTTTATTTATKPAVTSPTTLDAGVSVPNVVGLGRVVAATKLEAVGLGVHVETLPLANVPAGFVISQNPLPAARVLRKSTVSLVVSGAA